jgi:hypothetical protein
MDSWIGTNRHLVISLSWMGVPSLFWPFGLAEFAGDGRRWALEVHVYFKCPLTKEIRRNREAVDLGTQ